MKVIGVVGSPRPGGNTNTVVSAVLEGAAAGPDVETEVLRLCEYDLAYADGTRSDEWTGDTRRALDTMATGDAFVFGSPMYREGITGRLKNFLDLVPRGVWDGPTRALQARPVGVVGTGAAPEHFLGVHDLDARLISFFGAYVVPLEVYACQAQFAEDGSIADEDLRTRAHALGAALVALHAAVAASPALQAAAPQVRHRAI